MTAAGVGLTLTAACHVIFAQLFWNPGTLLQCEDRAHRIGQNRPVVIEYIVAKDTFDEKLWKLIEKKMGILGTIFDGIVDSLDATRTEAPEAEEASEDVPVDESLVNWILKKAFSWEERQRKVERRRAARKAAADGDLEEVTYEPTSFQEVQMADAFAAQGGISDDLIEIEVDDVEVVPPEYAPTATASRLARFSCALNGLS